MHAPPPPPVGSFWGGTGRAPGLLYGFPARLPSPSGGADSAGGTPRAKAGSKARRLVDADGDEGHGADGESTSGGAEMETNDENRDPQPRAARPAPSRPPPPRPSPPPPPAAAGVSGGSSSGHTEVESDDDDDLESPVRPRPQRRQPPPPLPPPPPPPAGVNGRIVSPADREAMVLCIFEALVDQLHRTQQPSEAAMHSLCVLAADREIRLYEDRDSDAAYLNMLTM